MAILQALLALLSRSAKKIVSTLFGWAVTALFGPTSARDMPHLAAVVGAAAAWPLLVLGACAPRVATFVLAFVPLPKGLSEEWVRLGWLAAVVTVPVVVGLVFSRRARGAGRREGALARLLRGVPITLGVASAVLVALISVPVRKLVAVARRRRDEHVPLVVEPDAYAVVARDVERALRGRFALARGSASWAERAPSSILRALGGPAFRDAVPERLAVWSGPDLRVVLHPNGAALSGRTTAVTRAHGVLDEAMARTRALQTTDPEAQAIEKQLRDVWRVLENAPRAHRGSAALASRLDAIAGELVELDAPYTDWQVVYRQALQLSRALQGARPLLARNVTADSEETRMQETAEPTPSGDAPELAATLEQAPLPSLLRSVFERGRRLLAKTAELAVAEAREDLRGEIAAAKGLAAAGVLAILGVAMVLVAAVFGLATFMPTWTAALAVSAPFLVASAILGYLAWQRRIRSPLATTRHSAEETLQWAKNRMA